VRDDVDADDHLVASADSTAGTERTEQRRPTSRTERPRIGHSVAVAVRRAQWWLAQVGRPSKKKLALGMLLTDAELPGLDWRTLGQVTFRMGMSGRLGAISRRARRSGEFSALRRFRQHDPGRGLFIQVGPYVSDSDAHEAMEMAGTSDGGWSWPGVERLGVSTAEGLHVPGLDDLRAWEHRTRRVELTGYQRFIAGRTGRVVLAVSGSAPDPGWPWDDLIPIAARQAAKVRSRLTVGAAERHHDR
jgi:hypothetical protein